MKTVMKPFMVQENSRILLRVNDAFSELHDSPKSGFWLVEPFMMENMKGLMIRSTLRRTRRLERPPSLGVAPPPSVNRRCGIRLAPGGRRPCRRQGRPLCPHSAHGRPLTAAAGARSRV